MEKLRVLSHYGGADAIGLSADLQRRVEVIEVAPQGPLPEGARGDVLLARRRATNLYEAAEGVRWVHIIGTGVDGVDISRLARTSVVTNSRGAAGVPIAEWTMATMLAYEKQLPETWATSPKAWARRGTRGHLGTLAGKNLAIVGLGSIGGELAKRALAFGMNVHALRRSHAPSPVDGVVIAQSLDALLTSADTVVLACPLTDETRHILDGHAFGVMKHGVHLVNVARGELIDDDALRHALDDGRVARASLDATSPEPLPSRHWLYRHRSVRLTPHISWSYPGAQAALTDVFIENLSRYLEGVDLRNVLDPQLSY